MNGQLDYTRNCTLEAYAFAKAMPLDFLRSLGLETIPNPYSPSRQAVQIPYHTAEGRVHRNRLRAALKKSSDGDGRLLWDRQPEAHGTVLYGLPRLKGSAFPAPATSRLSAMIAISRAARPLLSWNTTKVARLSFEGCRGLHTALG
jgi:hypothetical protein